MLLSKLCTVGYAISQYKVSFVQGKMVCTSKNTCLSMRAAFSLPHLAMCPCACFRAASHSLSPFVKLPRFCSDNIFLLWR